MKKNLLSFTALIVSITLQSQTVTPTVLSNNGDYSSSAGGSIAWTIGEPVSDTYVKSTNITTNGFHQPNLDLVAMVHEQGVDKDMLVYPNPVRDEIKINFSGMPPATYALVLNDPLGRLIYSSQARVSDQQREFIVKMNEVAAGNYFLIITGNDFVKTIKINKVY
jgi:hypothetical protein